jgi:two-component system C4-dicarboxylate transport response regulator DctD
VLGLEPAAHAAEGGPPAGLADRVDAFERSLIEAELRRARGNVVRTAEALGLPRKTLYDKLKRHGLDPETYRAPDSPSG